MVTEMIDMHLKNKTMTYILKYCLYLKYPRTRLVYII